jgi:hypothetical protein
VTLVPGTSPAAAHSGLTADAEQAAYFRAQLVTERDALVAAILHRRALISRGRGSSLTASQAQRAEAEARHIDQLIARLDRRFAAHWPDET